MVASNDDLVFLDDSEDDSEDVADLQPWRVLVVDDDQDVHEATRFGLAHLLILGRPLELLHAHSAREALELLQREGDIAVILLDVVMESDDAGLRTVGVIREQLKMLNTRIILRTGQPGQAPEADTIARYDINDYKTKSELTQNKLFTTLTAAIRSYGQLLRLDAQPAGAGKNRFCQQPVHRRKGPAHVCRRRHHADCQPDRRGPGGCGLRGLGRIHQPPPAR